MNVGGGGGPLGFSFGGGPGAGAPPASPVFAVAPGGGRIRGTPPPSVPVVLSRNGKEFTANGETNVRAGTEYKVITERPSVSINVKELDTGSWVMFELPGFNVASAGTEQSSLDALRSASATSYYKGNGSLWVKVVSTGDVRGSGPGRGPGAGDSLQVSR
jgi:cell migration-inducing and hyaluronan-binding protein